MWLEGRDRRKKRDWRTDGELNDVTCMCGADSSGPFGPASADSERHFNYKTQSFVRAIQKSDHSSDH